MISDKRTHGCSPKEMSVSANDKIDDRLEDDKPRYLICAPWRLWSVRVHCH